MKNIDCMPREILVLLLAFFLAAWPAFSQGLLDAGREAGEVARERINNKENIEETTFEGEKAQGATEVIGENDEDQENLTTTHKQIVVAKDAENAKDVTITSDAELDRQKADQDLDYQIQVFSTFLIREMLESVKQGPQLPRDEEVVEPNTDPPMQTDGDTQGQ